MNQPVAAQQSSERAGSAAEAIPQVCKPQAKQTSCADAPRAILTASTTG